MRIDAAKIKLLLPGILFILFISANSFAETAIKAQVEKTSITTDETLTYKITITSTEKKLPEPKIPDFKGFSVVSTVQSSTLSFGKNNINTTLGYAFILAPTDVGKFKIEPSKVTIAGRTYSSEAFEIDVKPGKAKPQNIQPESEQPQYTL